MGRDNGSLYEKPAHTVALDAFWIDQTEVTNAMYAKCVGEGICKEPTNKSSYTHLNSYGNSEFDTYPVVYVGWNMAQTYCEWAGRRLPTEAEWEKAARGTDGRTYPWGNEAPNKELLNYGNNIGDTIAVGSYANGISPYGAYDMAGNVWEWVSDWYDVYPGGDASASTSFGQTYRVLRGGSWDVYDVVARSALRYYFTPSYIGNVIGFRCARSP
jgi:serine/threonine-protein kinase